MKGIELPVNMVIIVIVAAVVLTVVGFFFLSQSSSLSAASLDQLHSEGCLTLRAAPFECDHASVNSVSVGTGVKKMSLGEVCASKGVFDSISCAKSCLCDTTGAANPVTLSKSGSITTGTNVLNLIPEEVDNV